jgi:hypothetical protein
MNILCIQYFWPRKEDNRAPFFGSVILKHSRHVDYWNQPLNMRMRVDTKIIMKMDCAAT